MVIPLLEFNNDLRSLKRALGRLGMPAALIRAVETRALRSGRRMTGQFRSNRQSRWNLDPQDPQYGSEQDCKAVLVRLLLQVLEFDGAPPVTQEVSDIALKYLGRGLAPGSYCDPLTRERLSYPAIVAEATDPRHGISGFHIGHENPQAQPKHVPENVNWRSARSNLLQGDLTIREARTKFVELIARYFDLGEVRIEPD